MGLGEKQKAAVELDVDQLPIVESKESMVVIAGPGSGKTRLLTEKARKLFNSGEDIICLCFTRSAAREMQERVPGLPASTIHSYCCGAVGWEVPPGEPEDVGYLHLLERFIYSQKKDGVRYDWVLLDECQDVNPFEFSVVLSLVGDRIFAVGDPHQSIYGFQNALGPQVIGWLKRAGCAEVALHNNYRSCDMIVHRLNRIFPRGLVSRGIKDTGLAAILCRKNDDVFEVSRYLEGISIPHRVRLSAELRTDREYDVIGESSLRVMTIHQSKGREFDKVVLYAWYPNEPGEEMRVYYTCIARASKTFVEVDNLSELRNELGL